MPYYRNDRNPESGYTLDELDKKVQSAKDGLAEAKDVNKGVLKKMKEYVGQARLYAVLAGIPFVLMVLFSLFFIVTRIVFSGFYAGEKHDVAMIALIVSSGLLFLLCVAFFAVFRMQRRSGAHFIRWLMIGLAAALSVCSFILLDAASYIVIVCALGVITLANDILLLLYLSKNNEVIDLLRLIVFPIVTALLIAGCAVLSFGVLPFDGKDAYVGIDSFKRNVRYVKDERGVRLEKIMLTVSDVFELEEKEAFKVLSEVKLHKENEPVSIIGKDAFKCVRSFSEVVLPEGIALIEAGAFENSKIKTLTIASAEGLTIEDGLNGSSIERIVIQNKEASVLSFGEGVSLREGITIFVPRESIDAYRTANPAIAERFAPEIGENEVFVNFNITAPQGSGILETYIATQIAEKNALGEAEFSLPYADLTDETSTHGAHWAYKQGDDIYRLFYLTVNGEKVGSQNECFTTANSLNVYGDWMKIHTVRADYTEIGGGTELLGELYEDSVFELPVGVTNELKAGYTCNEWYWDGTHNDKVETVSDFTQDYVVYPKWSLDKPVFEDLITLFDYDYSGMSRVKNFDTKVSKIDYPFLYDSNGYEIGVEGGHASADAELSYLWKKDGQTVSNGSGLTVTNVSDSGTYTVLLTAKDSEGNAATAEKEISLTVAPAALTVTAEAKNITYGEANLPLTYTYDGLFAGDEITGELSREDGNGAGVYAITQGTLSAGGNYFISYTGASYTIEKADYDMSAVEYENGTLTYNGQRQTVEITGELPTGLDGIQITVSYSGGAKDVLEGEVESVATFATASENYNVPQALTATTKIEPKALSVTAEDKTAVYGVPQTLTYRCDGLVDGDSFEGALTREDGDNVGEYGVLQGTLSAGQNYTISFTGATYTIVKADYDMSAVKYENGTLTYNGEKQTVAITGELPTGLDGIQITVSYSGGAKDVAEGAVESVATFATASENYNIPQALTATTKITLKTIFVTAEAKSVVYGNSDVALTYQVSGLVDGQTPTGGLTREEGNDAGEYDILLGTLSYGENYFISYTGAVYTIEKADYNMAGVSYENGTLTYNGQRQTVQITGTLPTGLDGIQITVSYSGGAKDVAEGEVESVATFATASENYNVPEEMTATTKIEPKTLSVYADAKSIVYGEANLPLTFRVSGTVDGQTPTGALTREAGNEAGEYDILLGTLTFGGNYTLSFTSAKYVVEQRMLTVTAENKSAVYGEGEQPLTYTVSGILEKDKGSVQVNATLTRESGNDVGVYDITITNVQINGSESYKAETVKGEYEIVRAESVIDVSGIEEASYIYTGLPQTVSLGASLNHSEGTLVYSDNVFTTVAEGNALLIKVSVAETKNYKAASATAAITVEKATAVIDTDGVVKIYSYTGETQTIASGATLNHGETQVSYSNNTFKDVPVGGSLTVKVFAEETANYKSAETTVAVTVNKAKVTLIAENKNVDYGEAELTLTYKTEGIAPADLERVTASATLAREEGNNAGVYGITFLSASITDAENYELTTVAGSYTIEKVIVEVPAQDTSFEHTGSPIEGISETELYTVADGLATEVGSYEATVTLRDGENYRWADEDFDGKVRWCIVDTDGLS